MAKADSPETSTTVFQAAIKTIEAGTEVLDAELDIKEAAVDLVVQEYEKGTLEITNGEKEKEIARLKEEIRRLRSQLVVRRSNKGRLAGEVADSVLLEDAEAGSFLQDWSFIDLLVSRYSLPAHATVDIFRSSDDANQARFRAALLKSYFGGKEPRCCITGQTITELNLPPVDKLKKGKEKSGNDGEESGKDQNVLCAAHIVPKNIGASTASYFFGTPSYKDGHLLSPQNGLLMAKHLEQAFNGGLFMIVPGSEDGEWKVIVLDEEKKLKTPDIDNKTLVFGTSFRPAKRYLYFAHILTILRRQRYRVPRWATDIAGGPKEVWASPGEYRRTWTSAFSILVR